MRARMLQSHFEMDKQNITRDTETTIAVNWSGGGSIKNPGDDWSIATLKRTAAAFPDLVAITPQRTYAILTKYTALESFHLQDVSPLRLRERRDSYGRIARQLYGLQGPVEADLPGHV
jgi:hypothetical protein